MLPDQCPVVCVGGVLTAWRLQPAAYCLLSPAYYCLLPAAYYLHIAASCSPVAISCVVDALFS